jgi:RNA polymerase sigma-70 factor (ECF subfamily)
MRVRREFVSDEVPEAPQDESPLPYEVREAAVEFFAKLPPVERAAVLLKDVFDLTLEETAAQLDSSVGAVKAALHQGRAKLNGASPESTSTPFKSEGPTSAMVERFIEAFNARDLNRLSILLREDATSEMVGMWLERGFESITKERRGILQHSLASTDSWRGEVRQFHGEPIGILWASDGAGEAVASIVRVEERDGAIARLRYYFFCPDVLAEVCGELGVPVRTNGYRPGWLKTD